MKKVEANLDKMWEELFLFSEMHKIKTINYYQKIFYVYNNDNHRFVFKDSIKDSNKLLEGYFTWEEETKTLRLYDFNNNLLETIK